nr:uncharacterized protein LOC127296823 isoform X2 [Lolium perenne]
MPNSRTMPRESETPCPTPVAKTSATRPALMVMEDGIRHHNPPRHLSCTAPARPGNPDDLTQDADLGHALIQPPLANVTKHVLRAVPAPRKDVSVKVDASSCPFPRRWRSGWTRMQKL